MCRKGLTLLEVLLAAMLVGLVGVAFGGILATSQRYYIQTMNITAAQSEGSFALEHMRRRLLPADRLIRFSATQLAFRANGLWRGYRLSSTDLLFAPDLGVAATQDPTVSELNGAATENPPVARNVVTFDIQMPASSQLEVVIVTQHSGGGDSRQVRLETLISPRGL